MSTKKYFDMGRSHTQDKLIEPQFYTGPPPDGVEYASLDVSHDATGSRIAVLRWTVFDGRIYVSDFDVKFKGRPDGAISVTARENKETTP